MKKKDSHRINKSISEEEMRRYLADEMSPVERHALEKAMLENDFESEAFDGLSMLDESEFVSDIHSLRDKINKKTKPKSFPIYWRMAATLAFVVLGLGTYFLLQDIEKITEPGLVEETIKELDNPPTESEVLIPADKVSDPPLAIAEETVKHIDSLPIEQEILIPGEKVSELPLARSEEAKPQIIDKVETNVAKVVNEQKQEEAIANLDVINVEDYHKDRPETWPIGVNQRTLGKSTQQRTTTVTGSIARVPEEYRTSDTNSSKYTASGRVVSAEDNVGLPGVNVLLKNQAIGTITNADGVFELEISKEKRETLVFSSIGYLSQQKEVAPNDSLLVVLKPDMTELSEIVVVGYGARKRASTVEPSESAATQNEFAAFRAYVKENLIHPEGLEDQYGVVRLQFTVSPKGQIEDIEILKSPGSAFEHEALRLLNNGPAWTPAIENGQVMARTIKLGIRFKKP
ncbi:MAG: TonB family protein [Cyclobacteriaceae bacterium]